jgi:hypothetical protein
MPILSHFLARKTLGLEILIIGRGHYFNLKMKIQLWRGGMCIA